jgi:hypothetical protein
MSFSSEIEAGAEGMADDVWGWCEKASAFGRTVTVKVCSWRRFPPFRAAAVSAEAELCLRDSRPGPAWARKSPRVPARSAVTVAGISNHTHV